MGFLFLLLLPRFSKPSKSCGRRMSVLRSRLGADDIGGDESGFRAADTSGRHLVRSGGAQSRARPWLRPADRCRISRWRWPPGRCWSGSVPAFGVCILPLPRASSRRWSPISRRRICAARPLASSTLRPAWRFSSARRRWGWLGILWGRRTAFALAAAHQCRGARPVSAAAAAFEAA